MRKVTESIFNTFGFFDLLPCEYIFCTESGKQNFLICMSEEPLHVEHEWTSLFQALSWRALEKSVDFFQRPYEVRT